MSDMGGKRGIRRVAMVLVAALLLSACGSRDTVLAEQVAAAQDAARRAEAAQKAAEKAANRIAGGSSTIEEAEPESPEEDFADDSEDFDNTIVAPPAPA